MRPLCVGVDGPQEVVVKDMREGSVTQVMTETCDGHVVDISLLNFKFGLLFA